MTPQNLLFILSDEHRRDISGCYGDTFVKTPNIDKLAARGTRFTNAYTPCPICVPARASLATGRWVHQVRAWDNAQAYHGEVPSWHHRLRANGNRVVSIGKLHFRALDDDNGFTQEVIPMHIVEGLGDLLGLIREPPAPRGGAKGLAHESGPGESPYNNYDRRITEATCAWLAERAKTPDDKPWCLFVSMVRPHFPLVAPPEFFAMYPMDKVPMPRLYDEAGRPSHPAVKALKSCMNYDDYFDEASVRRAIASYYGLVTFLDSNIGKVLGALDANGFAGNTRVIYTSDHGDNLGCRGLWGKSVMYEESAAIPFIVAGPDVAAGKVVDTPVSLVDCYKSIIEAVGCPLPKDDATLPSQSVWDIAKGGRPDRNVLSEYHAAASVTGTFMIRHGRWKYVHHVGYRPELFDLDADPGETKDLGADPAMESVIADCEAALRRICDPDAVNAQCFADQRAKIAASGGIEAIKARGDFGHTPAPGETPHFA